MDVKLLLKRGGLLTVANWPIVAIQLVAQTTFQVLLAVPIIGAAILVAVLLGADLANMLQGNLRDMFTTITDALLSEPVALAAFIVAFVIVLAGGSVVTFLVKGGTVDVMLAADAAAGPVERGPFTWSSLRNANCFSIPRFIAASTRLLPRYCVLGVALAVAYTASGIGYVAFIVYGYRSADDGGLMIGWTLVAALSAIVLVLWITLINLLYLLLQIVTAVEDVRLGAAMRSVARFVRAEYLEVSGVFLVVFGVVIGATLASALAWSGVGLIAFVPLVGLAVFPLQIAALLVRGLVFEYIGLMAMGAYITLYRRFSARDAAIAPLTQTVARPAPSA